MKEFIKAIIILGLFAFFGIATSKEVMDPCEEAIQKYLREDAVVFGYYSHKSNDTVVVHAPADSTGDALWDIQTDQLCKILRDSCNLNGQKVLVARWTDIPVPRQTPYGNIIYYRICP